MAGDTQAHISKLLTFQQRPDVGMLGCVEAPHFTWLGCHPRSVGHARSPGAGEGGLCSSEPAGGGRKRSDRPGLLHSSVPFR